MTDLIGYAKELEKLSDSAFENGALAMRLHIAAWLDEAGEPKLALRVIEEVPIPLRGNSP